jgi:uridine kinase
MKGDIIIVEAYHYNAAKLIVEKILPEIRAKEGRYTITVGGESGSGKSEMAKAIAEKLADHGIQAGIYQQDDYFIHPPKTNDATRRQDINWVGPQEVKLDLLDEHLKAALDGADEVTKPLVIYEEDRVTAETMSLQGLKVVIAEGTYTTMLQNVDKKVFIARNRLDTLETRKKRGREQMDPFIEEVLKIEHAIISKHREIADIIITKEYEVEL